MKKILLIGLLLIGNANYYAQSDECSGAPALTVGSSCSNTPWTVPGTFTNSTITYPGCEAGQFRDGWYSFVANSTFTNINVTNTNRTMAAAVYSACNAASMLSCADADPNQGTEVMGITTVAGQTYYIRIIRTNNNSNDMNGSICVYSSTPPPINDNPCSAAPLTVNPSTTCTTQTPGTVANATATGTALGSCFGTADDDVWYSFIAGSTSQIVTLNNVAGSTTDMYFSVHPGPCGSIGAALLCSDPNTGTVTGLTVGQTYFVRVYTWTSTPNQTSTFNVCVTTPPPPPPPPTNDNPCNATPLTVNPNYLCGTQTPGTVTAATATGTNMGTCFGTADDDVWFSFVATGSTHNISLNNITGSTSDMYFSVHSGACGNPGAAILCSDPENALVTGLTANNTYFVRVYTWTSTTGQTSSFNVCIGTPPPPPTNDNPCNATVVNVNPDFNCVAQTSGTVASATATGTALGSCFGTADDDVWFQFTATNASHQISLNNITGSTSDMYFSVHPGPCGSIGAALLCSDPETGMVTGLTPNTTYWIRVYTYTSTTGQTSSFSVCVGTPPPPPANDECAGAFTLTSSTNCITSMLGSIASATPSAQANSCFGTADDDVWYKFTASATTLNLTLSGVTGSTTDMYHSVYNGTCSSIGTPIICNDNNSSSLTGLTVNNVYYVRVYSYTSTAGQTSSYDICLQIPPPPPTNLTCAQMQPICSGSPISFTAQATGTAAEAGNNYSCLSTTPNPTWFYLQIAQPGVLAIDITAGSDVDFALWGPYANLGTAQATCGSHGSPIDCSYSASPTEQANLTNALSGQVYVLLVTNYANTIQSINLNDAFGNSATTNCAIVPLPIGINEFNATYHDDKVYLDWSTAFEINNAYFEIQRSEDGILWEAIGIQNGAGNSQNLLSYRFVDERNFQNIVYYRIKQVDQDGKFTFFPTRSVQKTQPVTMQFFPNPAEDLFMISGVQGIQQILMYDIQGRAQQLEFKSTGSMYEVNGSALSKGVYTLKVLTETGVHTDKIIMK